MMILLGPGCPPNQGPTFELVIQNVTTRVVTDVLLLGETGAQVSVLDMPVPAGTARNLQVPLDGLQASNEIEFELGDISLTTEVELFGGARLGFLLRELSGVLSILTFDPT